MKAWLPVLRERLREEPALIRVVVATVRGSAPREAGACMLIGSQRVDGTIGGGHLELKAIEIARDMLQQTSLPSRVDRFALGATLGQCCGGAVNLWFERFAACDGEFVATALAMSNARAPAVIVTLPERSGGIHRSLHTACTPIAGADHPTEPAVAAAIHSLLSAAPDAPRAQLVRMGKREALIERADAQGLPLWLFGAGHVGKALIQVLQGLPFQVTWIDSREHEFPAAHPAEINILRTDEPAAAVEQAPRKGYFLVMTHSHDLDYDICRALLLRNDFAWAGLIGSETKAACFKIRFAREDIPAHAVARLVSPIGIDGIDSKLPGAIAISVAAQLLQLVQAAQQSNMAPTSYLTGRLQIS